MAAAFGIDMFSPYVLSFVAFSLVTMMASVSCDQQLSVQCAWNEYYDEIMDDCGPCHEICDNRRLTRTEQQCNAQCSDYLVSKSCRADQYFDEMVKNCAPCVELCSQRDVKGTTKECFQKCRDYVNMNPPSNIVDTVGKNTDTSQDSSSSSSTSSWLPGIIASICIGVVASAAIVGLFIHYRITHKSTNYVRAPGNEVAERRGDATTGSGDIQSGSTVINIELQHALPIQVSSEQVTAEDISVKQQTTSVEAVVDSEDTQPKTVSMAIAECDPVAPSSAAAWHVHRQQSS